MRALEAAGGGGGDGFGFMTSRTLSPSFIMRVMVRVARMQRHIFGFGFCCFLVGEDGREGEGGRGLVWCGWCLGGVGMDG